MEPLGIALELAAKRKALAARLSPQARRLAFPELYQKPQTTRERVPPLRIVWASDSDADWSTRKRVPAAVKAERMKGDALRVIAAVAKHWGVAEPLIYAATKRHVAVRPRRAVMFLLRDLYGAGLPTIGKLLHRDHTTVKTGLERHADDYERDADYRERFDAALAELREAPITRNAATSDTAAAGGQGDGCTEQPSPRPLASN